VRWADIETRASITRTEIEGAADITGSNVSTFKVVLAGASVLVSTNWSTSRSTSWRDSWSGHRGQHLGISRKCLTSNKQDGCGCCESDDLLHDFLNP
jgi:exo-beta-1,3-glucanase (GH17 family)